MSDDREILERISQLAGQINRHKNQQAGFVPAPPQGSRYKPYGRTDISDARRRGGFPARGHHRARIPLHRHRTLVLNNGSSQSQLNKGSDSEPGEVLSDVSNSSWVTKTDRHLQIINSSVYEKEALARTRAIEQTRLQKQAMRDARERAKLIHHIHRAAVDSPDGSANSGASGGKYEIMVQGIRFAVVKNGSKLVRVPGMPEKRLQFAAQGLTETQAIRVQQCQPRRWPLSVVSDSTEAKTVTCTVMESSRPNGMSPAPYFPTY